MSAGPSSIFEGWLDVQQKSFIGKRKWQRRYIKIWTRLPAQKGEKAPGGSNSSQSSPDDVKHFSAVFTADSTDSKLAQRYNLRYYCNCKYRKASLFGENLKDTPDGRAKFLYVELVTSPDVPMSTAPTVVVRADREQREQVSAIRAFALACQEEVRSVCPVSARMKQAFDREIFFAAAVDPVPNDLVLHVRDHLQTFKPPQVGNDSASKNLYDFLLSQLETLLDCSTVEEATYHAKCISGFAARAARGLWARDKSEGKKQHEGNEGQTESLLEYQLRQLVEMAVFNGRGVSMMERLQTWVVEMPEVKALAAQLDKWNPATADEMLKTIPSPWFKKLQEKDPEQYTTVADTTGMLMPALEMVAAMGLCNTTVQKVRLWSEAILEAICLIEMQMGGGKLEAADIPSVALFLTCLNEMFETSPLDFVAHFYLAKLFCIDNYGTDARQFKLPHGGLWEDLADQYAFHADRRSIDHSHYLLWVEDTLQLMSEMSGADGEAAELLALGAMDINSSKMEDQEAEDCQRRSAVVIEGDAVSEEIFDKSNCAEATGAVAEAYELPLEAADAEAADAEAADAEAAESQGAISCNTQPSEVAVDIEDDGQH